MLEDFLLRFRRVWAPRGPAAGQAAVPTDEKSRISDELRELTAALKAIEQEGVEIVLAAEKEAAEVIASAQAEAERATETARSRLPEVRASRAGARFRDREATIEALAADAQKAAQDLRTRAHSRMPDVTKGVLADIFAITEGSSEGRHASVVGGG
jgi:cell division septum initiation protein DivIVA